MPYAIHYWEQQSRVKAKPETPLQPYSGFDGWTKGNSASPWDCLPPLREWRGEAAVSWRCTLWAVSAVTLGGVLGSNIVHEVPAASELAPPELELWESLCCRRAGAFGFGARAVLPPCAQLLCCQLHVMKDLPKKWVYYARCRCPYSTQFAKRALVGSEDNWHQAELLFVHILFCCIYSSYS